MTTCAGTLLSAFVLTPLANGLGARSNGFAGWTRASWDTIWWLITVQHLAAIAVLITLAAGVWVSYLFLADNEATAACVLGLPALASSVAVVLWLMISAPPRYGISEVQTYYAFAGLVPVAGFFALSYMNSVVRNRKRQRQLHLERTVRRMVAAEVARQLPRATDTPIYTPSNSPV